MNKTSGKILKLSRSLRVSITNLPDEAIHAIYQHRSRVQRIRTEVSGLNLKGTVTVSAVKEGLSYLTIRDIHDDRKGNLGMDTLAHERCAPSNNVRVAVLGVGDPCDGAWGGLARMITLDRQKYTKVTLLFVLSAISAFFASNLVFRLVATLLLQ